MRVKSAVERKYNKKKILAGAVGLRGRKKNCVDLATGPVKRRKMAITIGRKLKRRSLRTLWILRLSAFLRQNELKYSTGLHILKEGTMEKTGIKSIDIRGLDYILQSNPSHLVEILNNYKKNSIK